MEELSQEQYDKAKQWHNDHFEHVKMLIDDVEPQWRSNFPPCKEDKNHPNLWKAGSWRWFISRDE